MNVAPGRGGSRIGDSLLSFRSSHADQGLSGALPCPVPHCRDGAQRAQAPRTGLSPAGGTCAGGPSRELQSGPQMACGLLLSRDRGQAHHRADPGSHAGPGLDRGGHDLHAGRQPAGHCGIHREGVPHFFLHPAASCGQVESRSQPLLRGGLQQGRLDGRVSPAARSRAGRCRHPGSGSPVSHQEAREVPPPQITLCRGRAAG